MKYVSVTEGDYVLLHTDVTKVREDEDLMWNYGTKNSLIAKIKRHKQVVTYDDGLERRFRDRLKLDDQTGSLTITNITAQHAGVYKLQISGAKWSSKTFSVSVYGRLPVPIIYICSNSSHCSSSSSSSCSLLCSVVNVSHVTLSWYKGNSLLSSISVSDLSISLSLPLEVEHQDKNTYSCVINNPIRNQTTHLDFSRLCQTCAEPQISLFLTWLISAAGLIVICNCSRDVPPLHLQETQKNKSEIKGSVRLRERLQRTTLKSTTGARALRLCLALFGFGHCNIYTFF
ncbi:LOW QUALITY PROTEIN: CD48 antigen-like [Puntigrus tetrazona]|uniref:LOW QUALITY PROTEIN: CD48 antigen-like n=1 Tax=Puntigrus tetrazona TaxID=1606681 RepID=UPI001C893D95|nr:LOW QUALITY PROTEIN: CD48 antigen-like [Puntigrus tetrazona]